MYWAWYGWSGLLVWLDGQRHRRLKFYGAHRILGPIYRGVVRLVLLALVLVLLMHAVGLQKEGYPLTEQAGLH